MRRRNYLNGILTVNAVLLTGLLWVQVVGQPLPANTASAQSSRVRPPVLGTYDFAQRQKMIEELGKLTKAMEAMKQKVVSGTIKVEVTNLDAIGK